MAGTGKTRIVRMDLSAMSRQLAGSVVAEVAQPSTRSIAIRFLDGSELFIEQRDAGIHVTLDRQTSGGSDATGPRPTRRQLEYLEFIKKYMHRYGTSPAESDIQAHFLVSAPSVNQMVRTLERLGFIERSRDWFGQTVPRSIRVTWQT